MDLHPLRLLLKEPLKDPLKRNTRGPRKSRASKLRPRRRHRAPRDAASAYTHDRCTYVFVMYVHTYADICEYIYVYIYICMYRYSNVCVYVCLCMGACMCVCVRMYACVCVCMCVYVCVCVCMYVCMYPPIYLSIYLYVYAFTYVYIYVGVWIDTYVYEYVYLHICTAMLADAPQRPARLWIPPRGLGRCTHTPSCDLIPSHDLMAIHPSKNSV